MAALNVREDQSTGELILQPRVLSRLAGVLGNLIWILVVIAFFLLPSLGGGRSNAEGLIILIIVLLLSVIPSLGAFFFTTLMLDRNHRVLTRNTSLALLPIRSTSTPFAEIASIEVQFYRQSSGRSSHEAYRVNAIDKNGARIPLNWDGRRDEMLELGQRIAALTSVELIDHSEKPASQLQEWLERARQAGVPVPQTSQAAEPSEETMETMPSESPQPAPMTPEPLTELEATMADSTTTPRDTEPLTPALDLSRMSASELERMVAADPSNVDARYLLARLYHARGQLDRAIQMYQETLKVDSSNAEAQNDLGVALQQRGKRDEAQAAYRRAIALDPFSFNAHLNLALLLRSMNRAVEASSEFLQARQNAQRTEEKRVAEDASSGAKLEPRLSGE